MWSDDVLGGRYTLVDPRMVEHVHSGFKTRPMDNIPHLHLVNSANVLSKLVDIDTALAISYHWLKTAMKNQLYWSVGVDHRNVVSFFTVFVDVINVGIT